MCLLCVCVCVSPEVNISYVDRKDRVWPCVVPRTPFAFNIKEEDPARKVPKVLLNPQGVRYINIRIRVALCVACRFRRQRLRRHLGRG